MPRAATYLCSALVVLLLSCLPAFAQGLFGTITGTVAQGTLAWDAPATRVEIGSGWSIQRNLLVKLSYQHNTRDGGPLPRVVNLVAAQMVFWF